MFAVHTHISFFPLAFVLVNDLSLVSRCFLFWKCVRFCFRFCCRLFLFVVCTCILCLLPCHTRCSFTDVLSCTRTGVSEINHLKRQKQSDSHHAHSGMDDVEHHPALPPPRRETRQHPTMQPPLNNAALLDCKKTKKNVTR